MAKTRVSNNYNASNPDYEVRKVVNPTLAGDVQIVTSGFSLPDYDYVAVTYPSTTQEVYTYKSGGVSGTTVGTLTITYTDSTKSNLLNASKA